MVSTNMNGEKLSDAGILPAVLSASRAQLLKRRQSGRPPDGRQDACVTLQISVVIVLLLMLTTQTFAHTFHTSLTRIDYNEKNKTAEISIQLFSHDLVPALEKLAKKGLDLDKTPDVDKFILQYLDDKFVLQNSKGKKQALKFVGKELEVDTVYIYVEIPIADNLETYSLQNSLFFESFSEQTNLVTAHIGDKKIDLIYKSGDRFQAMTQKNAAETDK